MSMLPRMICRSIDMSKMYTYLVKWEITIEAEDEYEAEDQLDELLPKEGYIEMIDLQEVDDISVEDVREEDWREHNVFQKEERTTD